jgi:N-acyl-D-aspartate/D-glutamate deacylase
MILIKDSLVVDGTGKPPQRQDVLISENKIAAIGKFPAKEVDEVINGLGMITSPGFIDVNTDSDHYLSLFTDPAQQDFLLQGVTTIIGGHCGSSLAPLLYGTLESIRKWSDTDQVNVDWNTVAELLKTLEKIKLGVNFGTLVGHSTIRRSIIGEAVRDLTVGELDVFKNILKRALEEGALGFSTGLGYNHGKNAGYAEIKFLAQVVAKLGGVYTTHLRHQHTNLPQAVTEAVDISRQCDIKTIISHFRPLIGFEKQFEQALKFIEGSDANIWFDGYPFDYSIVPIYTLLPEWAQSGSLEQMMERLNDKYQETEIFKSLVISDLGRYVIARAPGLDYLVGKTVAEFSKNQELVAKKAMIQLMKITKLRAVLFDRNVNLPIMQKALLSERSLVASNSPSLVEGKNVIENERATETFSRFFSLIKNSPDKKIEWAIEKLTSRPAGIFNLKGRGVLKEGAIADVAVFRLGEPRAEYVFVNGKIAVRAGKLSEGRYGSIIRRI